MRADRQSSNCLASGTISTVSTANRGGGDEQHDGDRHLVVGPAVHHLAERLGTHAHGRGHGHHFAGHCLGRTELDGGHGDEIREATGDHRAAGEYDQHHEFGPCVDRQQEHNTLWDHGQRKRRHQPRQPAHRELGGEQAGDECARHAGNTDQAVGDAVDSGVEAEHCTNRVREADAGIADKHKVERRREQQQSEHVRPVLDEESHACLEVFKSGVGSSSSPRSGALRRMKHSSAAAPAKLAMAMIIMRRMPNIAYSTPPRKLGSRLLSCWT